MHNHWLKEKRRDDTIKEMLEYDDALTFAAFGLPERLNNLIDKNKKYLTTLIHGKRKNPTQSTRR